jgi:hypothetical protein
MTTCDLNNFSYNDYISGTNDNYEFDFYEYLEDRLECTIKFLIMLGAVFGWVYNKRWGWCFILKYWFVEKFIAIVEKYVVEIQKLYFSGFMSRSRGLHWVRNNES